MPWFNVRLDLRIRADIGIGAAEHLTDTFNDDKSIDPMVRVEVIPERKVSK